MDPPQIGTTIAKTTHSKTNQEHGHAGTECSCRKLADNLNHKNNK